MTSAKSVVPSTPSISAPAESGGPVTYFYGLGLHLGSSWIQVKEEMDLSRAVVVDAKCTQQPQPSCLGFVVAPIESDPSVRSDLRLENGCWSNAVIDDRYYGFPERVGTLMVGGQPVEYYKYHLCSRETGQQGSEIMHMWKAVAKGVVVYDLNLDGKQPTPGLESLLAGVTWRS
ncbi:MAG TPA: hypothetical protein VFH06_02095 [Candidatus Saccharimonadales bacterium]|nr:hypothetical protein [Candidatus Saccharimonadales bacterium]